MAHTKLTITVPKWFDLRIAVCSYGYFVLMPNRWDRERETLSRALVLGKSGQAVGIVIRQVKRTVGRPIVVQCGQTISRDQQLALKSQVRRMLRLDEVFDDWFRRSQQARKDHFAVIFRSPTLWEDMVKTITGCNTAWSNTITMNRLIVEHYGEKLAEGVHTWPSPKKIARCQAEPFAKKTKVGYRAERIIRLAKMFVDGSLDSDWYESPERSSEELYDALLKLYGFGPYAASNMVQHLGHYDRLAIDSETYRHYCELKQIERPKNPATLNPLIEQHYQPFGPWKFLAYWHELWTGYQYRHGKAHDWEANGRQL